MRVSSTPENNPLWEYFQKNGSQRTIDKWHHYFDIYHNHFERFRGKSPTVLEIGIWKGGSLRMWKDYFGEGCKIVGVDRDTSTAQFAEDGVDVHIGNQIDTEFLQSLNDKYDFDIIIDDGGHYSHQQIISFNELYGSMKEDGVYLAEDTHTNYWTDQDWNGVAKDTLGETSFIDFTKKLIDELNGYHSGTVTEFTRSTTGLHFYDSIVVMEKMANRNPPVSQRIPS